MGALKRMGRSRMQADPWRWGWEAVAALATSAATVVALGIAIGGGLAAALARRAQARAAMVALWPHLHFARGALFGVKMHLGKSPDLLYMDRGKLGSECAQLFASIEAIELQTQRLTRKGALRMTSLAALSRYAGLQAQRIADESAYPMMVMLHAGLGDQIVRETDAALALIDKATNDSELLASEETGRKLPQYENHIEGEGAQEKASD